VSSSLIGAEGCARCHQDVTEQWSTSAHRFASFNNPFYEATIRDLRTESLESNQWIDAHLDTYQAIAGPGEVKSKWCAGCHDPALLFTGTMGAVVESASVEAQAGLTCLTCHSIVSIHDQSGNGNYRLDDLGSDGYLFASAGDGTFRRFLHDGALRARPAPHKQRMLKPFFKGSEYCATCHKVSLTEPLNNYRWLRGQNDFDAWEDSGISLNAARTFYLPGAARVCQDCHMPPEPAPLGDLAADSGTVRSHRFLAVKTALPYLRDDTETVARIERFLQDEKLRVDIFALTREGATLPEMDLRETGPALRPGERISLDVVVRNLGVGHTFPGGTNDSNQGWLEVTVEAPDGTTLAVSGALDEDGRLDPSAHVFSALLLDREGRAIDRRNAQDIHVTVFANVIGPGSADIARYELTVPPEMAGSSLRVTARLLWRKFNQGYTVFAFQANPEGFSRFQDVPEIPVTEIERDVVVFPITDEVEGGVSSGSDPQRWILFNDYGIALLGDGNTRLARVAFARVEEMQPSRWDGPLNLAKVALADGDLEGAYQALDRVEALESGNPRAAWVWGQVLQEDGRYEEAVQAYQRVLDSFPGDRATWRALGRTLYLDQQFEAAMTAFSEVLEIDPEDRVSHYHMMLSLRALGREGEAALAEEAYRYYSIDESAQEITRAYRLRDEGANLMAQPIPTHILRPPT